jgi:hypothetical protein
MTLGSIEGACLCEQVRFELRMPTLLCAHCHCSMCRRAHGAGYVTWIRLPKDQLRFLSGEEALTHYRSSDHATRSFCRGCGSSLFFETTHSPETIDVVLANLAGAIDREPQLHVHFDDRVDWIHVADDLPRIGDPAALESPSSP